MRNTVLFFLFVLLLTSSRLSAQTAFQMPFPPGRLAGMKAVKIGDTLLVIARKNTELEPTPYETVMLYRVPLKQPDKYSERILRKSDEKRMLLDVYPGQNGFTALYLTDDEDDQGYELMEYDKNGALVDQFSLVESFVSFYRTLKDKQGNLWK